MSFFDRMIERFEIVGRARTLSVLRQQSDRTLVDLGFSPELVRTGIKAWPWRVEDQLSGSDTAIAPGFAGVMAVDHTAVANVGQIEVMRTGKAANSKLETAA